MRRLWIAAWVMAMLVGVGGRSGFAQEAGPVGGVGMVAEVDRGVFRVVRVVANGTAAKAGIEAGDVIVAIDGRAALADDDPAARIRGTVGTEVKLTIKRGEKEIEFAVRRAAISPPAGNAAPAAAPVNPLARQPVNPIGESGGGAIANSGDGRGLHAPSWVKPGLRLTYFNTAALVALNDTQFVQDDAGHWVDKGGQRYGERGNPGGGGSGYTQMDILAVHDDAVAYESRGFIQMPDRFVFGAPTGGVSPPARCGDTWVHPELLKKQADMNTATQQVYRQPYKLGEKTYHGFCTSKRTETSWMFYVYDEETGLLLHCAMELQEPAKIVEGEPLPREGNRTMSQATLVSLRQVDSPWAGAPLPAAVREMKRLSYEGTYSMNAAGPVVSWPYRLVLTMHAPKEDFVTFSQVGTTLTPGAPPAESKAERVTSERQLMPVGIDPAALAKVHSGQELDRDPVTKYTVTVAAVGRDNRGNDVVVLRESAGEENPRYEFAYDRKSGLLSGVTLIDPGNYTQVRITLAGNE